MLSCDTTLVAGCMCLEFISAGLYVRKGYRCVVGTDVYLWQAVVSTAGVSCYLENIEQMSYKNILRMLDMLNIYYAETDG